jgi:hypothetical protein
MTADLKPHAYCEIFPPLDEESLKELSNDIRNKGMRRPVVTFEGAILDGRNRYLACRMASIEPECIEYNGDDPLGYVISLNFHRRHLDESQRAIVAAKIGNLPHGGDRKSAPVSRDNLDGSRINRPIGRLIPSQMRNVGNDAPSERQPGDYYEPPGISQAAAAKMMNVGERSVRRATQVLKHGTPEVIDQVSQGGLSVAAAVKTIRPEAVAAAPSQQAPR